MRHRKRGFGKADIQAVKSQLLDGFEVFFGCFGKGDGSGAVHLLGHGRDFFDNRRIDRIGKGQGPCRFLTDCEHFARQILGAFPAFGKAAAHGKAHTEFLTVLAKDGDFFFGVTGKVVHRNNDTRPEVL